MKVGWRDCGTQHLTVGGQLVGLLAYILLLSAPPPLSSRTSAPRHWNLPLLPTPSPLPGQDPIGSQLCTLLPERPTGFHTHHLLVGADGLWVRMSRN